MSWKLKWNEKGLGILGPVHVDFGSSLFEFPINKSTLRHFQRTTPTAVYASPIYEHICVKHLISQQINNATWVPG